MLQRVRVWYDRIADKWRFHLPERTNDELKHLCRILFIDDQKFDVPEILRTAGWQHARSIQDVDSIEDTLLADAHIVFVDISGVGRALRFSDEGLGLISAIRKKYLSKKLVVYSAQRRGDRFHEGLSAADARLPKNADPFEFQELVEDYAKQTFCLAECVSRLQVILKKEFNLSLSEEEIHRRLRHIGGSKTITDALVEQTFNIQNAGAIASIVSVFIKGG